MREAARASMAKSRQALQASARNFSTSRSVSTKAARSPDKEDRIAVKDEPTTPEKPTANSKRKRASERTSKKSSKTGNTPKKIKLETQNAFDKTLPELAEKFARSDSQDTAPADISMKDPTSLLKDRKLKAYALTAGQSPFPDFPHPTPAEAKLAHKILQKLHGARNRPKTVVARQDRAGCGDSPSVLDALVRTILSQNTSDVNSTRAKRSMDAVYGGSDRWDAIVQGGQPKLEEAIRSGGLSQTKSRVIISILDQVKERYGEYSLDHLFNATNEEAMQEMLGFQGVGPKTASCVLLFCLQRESFAVDTHVHRIAGLLGWRPAKASRDETHAHLDVRIPDEDKYGLHILMVTHGKRCDECRAGGKHLGKCELRKAFRKGKLQGNAGAEVKEEEEKAVKKE